MSKSPPAVNPYFTSPYINGVYIPSGLLVFGCLIVKKEWVPYAIVLALALGGYKVFSMGMLLQRSADQHLDCRLTLLSGKEGPQA